MKFTKKYQVLSIFIVAFLTTGITYSQSMLQGEPSQELREAANEQIDMWTRELALTTKQADLMENKIIEFAIKKGELINSKMREEAKTERLKALQLSEIKDMRDILTKPQHERYRALLRERINKQGEENPGTNE